MNYVATYLAKKYNTKKSKLPVIRFALSISSVASMERNEVEMGERGRGGKGKGKISERNSTSSIVIQKF